MKLIITFSLLLAVNALAANAWFFSSDNWNDLKVTWGLNIFSSHYFVSLPRNADDAKADGWKLDKDCSKINGNRYLLHDDKVASLIFDANGKIAGIAASLPKGLPFNFPSKQIQGYFTDEGDQWTLTAYFTDPNNVCKKSPEGARQQTGDRVVIKGDRNELNIPLKENQITSFWTKGQCFYTMGNHWWANVRGVPLTEDVDPDEFFPMFLQYNSGNLNGFGWAFNANMTSPRCEHPTYDVLPKFFKQVPKFINDPTKAGVLSTMHIYLDKTPQLNFC